MLSGAAGLELSTSHIRNERHDDCIVFVRFHLGCHINKCNKCSAPRPSQAHGKTKDTFMKNKRLYRNTQQNHFVFHHITAINTDYSCIRSTYDFIMFCQSHNNIQCMLLNEWVSYMYYKNGSYFSIFIWKLLFHPIININKLNYFLRIRDSKCAHFCHYIFVFVNGENEDQIKKVADHALQKNCFPVQKYLNEEGFCLKQEKRSANEVKKYIYYFLQISIFRWFLKISWITEINYISIYVYCNRKPL